jgi:hypothetical protein
MVRKKIFCIGPTIAAKAEQKFLVHYWHDKPNEPTKEVPLSFVLFESPFSSVSTVSRGHPSLVSLVATTPYSHRGMKRTRGLVVLAGCQNCQY